MPIGTHHRPATKRLRAHAKHMRRGATDAETAMWLLLRDRRLLKVKFRRQVPFRNYILDFVCLERRLVVEIDGSQHADSKRDERRDALLVSEGFQVVRYWTMTSCNDAMPSWKTSLQDLNWIETDPSPGALRAPPSPTRGEGRP